MKNNLNKLNQLIKHISRVMIIICVVVFIITGIPLLLEVGSIFTLAWMCTLLIFPTTNYIKNDKYNK